MSRDRIFKYKSGIDNNLLQTFINAVIVSDNSEYIESIV